MRYHFQVHREKAGYWAACIELKGCVTQADTRAELDANMREALALYLDEPESSRLVEPLPKRGLSGRNVVAVSVEPRVAFAFLLRRIRLANKLSQTKAAEKIGIRGLYGYQRLESARTANPELETLAKIKKAFPEFNLNEVFG
jgi:antitoxin HicB